MKPALRKWLAFGVKKSKLFERSEFLDFSQKAVIFSWFYAALTFFVTFLCQDKKVRLYRGKKTIFEYYRKEIRTKPELNFNPLAYAFTGSSAGVMLPRDIQFLLTGCT